MHKKLISDIDKGVTECLINVVEFVDDEEKEIITDQPKYELKEACNGIYLHKVGVDIDETVFIEQKHREEGHKVNLFPKHFFEIYPDPVVKELFDDIKKFGGICFKCKQEAVVKSDWLVQFMIAILSLENKEVSAWWEPNKE